MLSFSVLSFRSLSARPVSLFVLCDDMVLLEDVIGRRLFKALLPRISVLLLARIAGLPAVNIESPVGGAKIKQSGKSNNFSSREKREILRRKLNKRKLNRELFRMLSGDQKSFVRLINLSVNFSSLGPFHNKIQPETQ